MQSLRKGVPYNTACQRAGIHSVTGWRWRKQDQRFDERCNLAESACERKLVQELLEGGQVAIEEEPGSDNRYGELDALLNVAETKKTKHGFPDAVRSQNIRWFLERRWPGKYSIGPIREKAWDREREESEGAADSGALSADVQRALVEFARARTDERTWEAFQEWMRSRPPEMNAVESQEGEDPNE